MLGVIAVWGILIEWGIDEEECVVWLEDVGYFVECLLDVDGVV